MELLHKEFQALRESLEFSQQQVVALTTENEVLREIINSLTKGMTQLCQENKYIKDTIIKLQAQSMREDLVISGIPEQVEEDLEMRVKNASRKS